MRVVTALVASLLAGCLGELPPGPSGQPDGGTAKTPDAADTTTAAELFKHWSGCMTLANFQAANMAKAWGTLASANNRVCANCHDYGAFGFIATTDEAAFFAAITQHSTLMSMYFMADIPNKKVVINTSSFKAANNLEGHPPFDPVNNAGMTALDAFYKATEANTSCGTPTLID